MSLLDSLSQFLAQVLEFYKEFQSYAAGRYPMIKKCLNLQVSGNVSQKAKETQHEDREL